VKNLRVGPLVRAISSNEVAIWTEWSHRCEVTLTATPTAHQQEPGTFSVRSQTVKIGGRYYALSRLTGLLPATWYDYQVSDAVQERRTSSPAEGTTIQCFRTFDLPDAGSALRLAYGSCRKLSTVEPDALSALGPWLLRSLDQRESLWPRLLLLIGDQIYADDRLGRPEQAHSSAQHAHVSQIVAAQPFEEFARMYEEAWAGDEGIRQVLAVLPTYMIFDDHEIANGWNISPTWRAHALQQGLEQTLVDGLVAYWAYQGWGNIGLRRADEHTLLAIMQNAAHNGEDALEALRECMRQVVYEETTPRWYYDILTTPPIFVADVRASRPALSHGTGPADVVPRIMNQEQMEQLRAWLQAHNASTALLVSSVPTILPPLIGFAEYMTGVPLLQGASSGALRRLGRVLADGQQKLAQRMSFDHWPRFNATWRELIALLASRKRDIVILSGDVHFSYAMTARRAFFPTQGHAVLYQLVASPFRNTLERRDKRLVLVQAWIKRAVYGGLHARVLPLIRTEGAKRVPSDMLCQNVVALVTCWPQRREVGKYCIRQVYLGVEKETLKEIAFTMVSRE